MVDIEKPGELTDYLRLSGKLGLDENPDIHVLAGGVSNRTVLVRFADGRAWVLKQALAKLRVQVDWFSDPARIHREAAGLRTLQQIAPPGSITPFVFEDHEHHLFAMQAVPDPHENWKTSLLAGDVRVDHVEQFARLLGVIHRRGFEQRSELSAMFEDRSFFESLRLEPYYAYAAAQVPQAAAFLHELIADCRSRRLTLVHGDYSPKNILICGAGVSPGDQEGRSVGFHPARLVLLDHEVIHWGDPAFDLGFALTHLLSKAHHLPAHRSAFAAAAEMFWSVYSDALGDVPWAADLEPHAVRHTLGCLLARVAGRSQLEYLTDDEKARQRDAVLRLLGPTPTTLASLAGEFLSSIS